MAKRRVLVVAALVFASAGLAVGLVVALHERGRPALRAAAPTTRARRQPRRRPEPRIVAGPHRAPVPILMYHVISAPPRSAPYPELYVRPAVFAGQMNWLARHGYHGVTLLRVWRYWKKGYALPRRPVVITFDDGYLSDYTHGFRVLRAHRWPAVLNLEVNHVKTVGGMLPWRVRNLVAAGWEIDAHTITHPDLTTVSAARLQVEVAGSRRRIRRMFGVLVPFFCYPSGRFDARVIAAVRRAHYLGATTVRYGLASPRDRFTMNRVRINGSDGVKGFAAKLAALTGS